MGILKGRIDGQIWPKLGWIDIGVGITASVVALASLYRFSQEFSLELSPDSIAYLAAARGLTEGHGLLEISGTPLTVWPPGYPVLLGMGGVILGDFIHSALIINLLAVAGVATLASVLIGMVTSSLWIRFAALISVIFSPALIAVSGAVWSDAAFAFLALAALTALSKFLLEERPLVLYIAALAAAAAALVRYVGITVAIAGVVALLAARPISRATVRQAVIFASVSLAPITVLLTWNLLNTGTPRATGRASCVSLLPLMLRTVGTVTRWWVVVPIRDIQLAGVVGGLMLAVFFSIVWRRRSTPRARYEMPAQSLLFVMTLFVLTYVFTLIVASLLSDLDWPADRLLAPIYIPVLVLFTSVLDRWFLRMHQQNGTRGEWRTRAATLAAVGVLVLLPVARIGYTYNARASLESADVSQIRLRSSFAKSLESWSPQHDERVYSNSAPQFFLITGNFVHDMPRTSTCITQEPHSQAYAFERLVTETGGPVYLAWFGHLEQDATQKLRDLGAEIVFSEIDGSLWVLPN